MRKPFAIILISLYCSCKTAQDTGTEKPRSAATTPGTCNIKGEIVSVLMPEETDTGSICSKYPCRAFVKILEVYGCGSGVSLPLNLHDTVEMKFAYTLHCTEIIPNMTGRFPGLQKGDVFLAGIQQRLVMGGSGEFVVYDYELK